MPSKNPQQTEQAAVNSKIDLLAQDEFAKQSYVFGKQSMKVVLTLLAFIVLAAFIAELLIMMVLPQIVPSGASKLTEALFDATLIASAIVVIALPLMLYYRRNTLRRVERSIWLQTALDQHAIVSMTDSAGKITYANDQLCKISGHTREELLGKNHRLNKSAEHSGEFFAEFWQTISAGKVWRGEICNSKRDGSLYWTQTTVVPFASRTGKPQQYVALQTDITAQKAFESSTQKLADQLRMILDNLGEGVYTLDENGRVIYLNAEAERLIGWRQDECFGRPMQDIVQSRRIDGGQTIQLTPFGQAMQAKQAFRTNDELFTHRQGVAFPVALSGSPLTLGGGKTGMLVVFSDLREEQLLQQRLLEAKNSAEAAMRLKAEFLSTMSHEIRTPLNGVIGMTDLMLDTPLNSEQGEFMRTIKLSANALMSIVNDVLDYSKIEAGQMAMEHTEFSVREVIEDSVELLAARANEKALTLASVIMPKVPDRLLGDPTRIRQVLLNFISNAIKFTAKGEVEVRADCEINDGPDAAPGTSDRHIAIKLSVRDSGIGLSDAVKLRLFEPFAQADSSTTRKYGGTGLGLSISKRLVEAMGGDIGVESTLGGGSTFWIRLVLEVAQDSEPEPHRQENLRGRFALIAGDSLGCRMILGTCFTAWRMRHESIETLALLRQRVVQLKGRGAIPDLVVLAHPLQDATLSQAIVAMQEEGVYALVCCLPQSERDQKQQLEDLGAVVMQKPIKQSALLDSLMNSLFRAHEINTAPAPLAEMGGMVGGSWSSQFLPTGPKRHLLLAEDNAINQKVASQVLQRLGYTLDVVTNGMQAVEAAASGLYDLVLMDCQMPEMDGFEATQMIRAKEQLTGNRLPVLAMTANALLGDRERCLQAGMDDYIAKPIDAIRLAELLDRWLPQAVTPDALGRAKTPKKVAAAASAPSIEMSHLIDLLDGDHDMIDELLSAYAVFLKPLQARLNTALADPAASQTQLKAMLHELRGASSNVGANALVDLARQLEKLISEGNFVAVSAMAGQADNEMNRAANFIKHHAKMRKV